MDLNILSMVLSTPAFDDNQLKLSEIVERAPFDLVQVGSIVVFDKLVTISLVLENGDSPQILLDIPKMRIPKT